MLLKKEKSLTLGLDYKLDYTLDYENKKPKDKFLEFKLASVFRDKFEDKIQQTQQ